MKNKGVYIHVPFCERKCHYCHFLSSTHLEGMGDYVRDLVGEIRLYQEDLSGATTLYLGGGTPSLLEIEDLKTIFAALGKRDFTEITIEVNPESLTAGKLEGYRALGINRISMGIQTSHDRHLVTMGRGHDFTQAAGKVALIKASGFENFNIDLIYGLPGQSLKEVGEDLAAFIGLGAPHISTYGLSYDEGTDFHQRLSAGLLEPVTDDLDREMFALIKETLEAEGLMRYEISNFARPGYESRHNLIYWSGEPYVGLGPGAHGHLEGLRYENHRSFSDYHQAVVRGERPRGSLERPGDEEFEYIMLNLRKVEGFEIEDFNRRFKKDFLKSHEAVLGKLTLAGVIEIQGGRVFFTDYGFDISNEALVHFMG